MQALGSSPVLSIGAGTISDIYPKQERGTAMGLFYVRNRSLVARTYPRRELADHENPTFQLGVLVGPATAPAIAGLLTEYVKPRGYGWRAMQWLLAGLGVSAFLLVLFTFPETAHARGIDQVKELRAQTRAAGARTNVEGR